MTEMIAIGPYLSLINGATIAAFAWEKHCARNGYWRVPENTLLTMAFMGGILGAVAAQHGFRHKTRKEPFRTHLYMIAGLHLTAVSVIMIPSVRNALWSQANWWP